MCPSPTLPRKENMPGVWCKAIGFATLEMFWSNCSVHNPLEILTWFGTQNHPHWEFWQSGVLVWHTESPHWEFWHGLAHKIAPLVILTKQHAGLLHKNLPIGILDKVVCWGGTKNLPIGNSDKAICWFGTHTHLPKSSCIVQLTASEP